MIKPGILTRSRGGLKATSTLARGIRRLPPPACPIVPARSRTGRGLRRRSGRSSPFAVARGAGVNRVSLVPTSRARQPLPLCRAPLDREGRQRCGADGDVVKQNRTSPQTDAIHVGFRVVCGYQFAKFFSGEDAITHLGAVRISVDHLGRTRSRNDPPDSDRERLRRAAAVRTGLAGRPRDRCRRRVVQETISRPSCARRYRLARKTRSTCIISRSLSAPSSRGESAITCR